MYRSKRNPTWARQQPKPRFAMVTTKTGACLESDPARNQSGFNLSAHQSLMSYDYYPTVYIRSNCLFFAMS